VSCGVAGFCCAASGEVPLNGLNTRDYGDGDLVFDSSCNAGESWNPGGDVLDMLQIRSPFRSKAGHNSRIKLQDLWVNSTCVLLI
jgi:hypothetical protein